MSMRYLSLFSGIEAATVAWHPIGWQPVAFAEIEPFPCAVLRHYYPDVPNLGDVTAITESRIADLGPIDLVVFGSPCQDLSVAGKRKGLADDSGNITRSGLFFAAIDIIGWARQHCGLRFALWENVPGSFTSNKGRDFAAVVGALGGMEPPDVPPKGWGTEGVALGEAGLVEWSTLDAQWFGVAQRRRRVFALADFGDWTSRPPVLLEPESLRGDTAPSREKGQETTGGTPLGIGPDGELARALNACKTAAGRMDVSGCLTPELPQRVRVHGVDGVSPTLSAEHGRGHGVPTIMSQVIAPTLTATNDPSRSPQSSEVTKQVEAVLMASMAVRRLTPVECERLQGFPDNYTEIPWRGKTETPDGPRYKALGNSMAVPVMRWIGNQLERIK